MKEIERFHEAADRLADTAARIRQTGRKIIGYPCSYAPEELIHAAGCHPMRLFSSGHGIVQAENHLQSYCCSLVRGMLEDSLAGRLDFLDGTVFPHTCDSMQRLSDIWRMNGTYAFFADLVLPVKLDTPGSAAYIKSVLARCKADLETALGISITDADLAASIALFNRIRTHLAFIHDVYSRHPGQIRGSDMAALVKGTMIMDRNDAAALLADLAASLQDLPLPDTPVKRVVLAGSVCDTPDLFDSVEAAGGAVVGDDLCNGQRWFDTLVAEDKPPLTALADRYRQRAICPAKHAGLTTRADHLVSLVDKTRADGVLFVMLKFCDPHAFDYPYLKETLDAKKIKSMVLEIDDGHLNQGQFSTRIETFIHML
ncbi:MAG: 2-hydroxyacyl-CoA dehydratase family protein [Desulfotignum sp.]|nr:2-hydroxyacyl-CoA dehydratase family protein [Desulfotignum sp.]